MKNKKEYKHLIFDADHTLLNYLADEREAFKGLYQELGLPQTDELMSWSKHLSESIWTAAGLYDVHSERIQREYHALYRSHVTGIFEEVFSKYPCKATPREAGERFLKLLERESVLMDGAAEILSALSKNTGGRYAVSIATNGLSSIQRGRLSRLLAYTDNVFISEELGCIKPLPAFFEAALNTLSASADECLMIGDSLSSDIAGANAVGMDSCWFNGRGIENDSFIRPKYEIAKLSQLRDLLL